MTPRSLLLVGLMVALTVTTGRSYGTENAATTPLVAELEAGPVWQTRNDVRIPNDRSASRFSLIDLQGNGPWRTGRLYVTWSINDRHSLRALAAPLSFSEIGRPSSQIAFNGATFGVDTPTEATYKFNSYRLTYAYRIHDGPRWTWWFGLTAKIRDAKVELHQGNTSSTKTDLGFVPLLHARGLYRLSERWRLALDVDALAGGPGRAEDAALKLVRDFDDHWSVSAGYRMLEGGADVKKVYAFAWLHYAVASLSYRY